MTQQEQAPWYALTTIQRVKNRLAITDGNSDMLLTKYVASNTDFIERECGLPGLEKYPNDGHFVAKKYTNEQYSVRGAAQKHLVIRNKPLLYMVVTATLTPGSAVVTVPAGIGKAIAAGMPLYDIQGKFPQGTTVLSVNSDGTQITMSSPSSASGEQTFEISGLIAFQWKSGPPSNPTWIPFITDQYEVVEQGAAGIIRVYGTMPTIYSNMLRLTYVAGYPVDWPKAGNGATHRLPGDLSELCEDLVIRAFKRKEFAGKISEGFQGSQTAWRDLLDSHDLNIIDNYRHFYIG